MSYPQVQFVAAPEDGAAVLFDFNNDLDAAIEDGTFSLGTPEILGDPDGLGVQYGPRTIAFDLLLHGTRGAALAAQAELARTFMLRRRGWLRIRLDELSTPLWARTYTPTPGELDFSMVLLEPDADTWRIGVQVAAEPFVRTERIELGEWIVSNDPAAATNPMSIAVPAILGDAPAPLRIDAAFSDSKDQSDILWSCAAVPAGYAPQFRVIGGTDGLVAGADTSNVTTGASAFSGGNYRLVTFASTPGMATRLSGTISSIPAGRYQVFLRAARDNLTGTFAYRFGRGGVYGEVTSGSPVSVFGRGADASQMFHTTWVDLGAFDLPLPRGVTDMASVDGVPDILIQAQRLTSGSYAILDALLFVPIDIYSVTTLEPWEKSDTLVSEFSWHGPGKVINDRQVWDGDTESSVRKSAAGALDATVSPVNRGKFPTVRPGVNNHLTLIQQVRLSSGSLGGVDNTDELSHVTNVRLSYQPRWLWLGAG